MLIIGILRKFYEQTLREILVGTAGLSVTLRTSIALQGGEGGPGGRGAWEEGRDTGSRDREV